MSIELIDEEIRGLIAKTNFKTQNRRIVPREKVLEDLDKNLKEKMKNRLENGVKEEEEHIYQDAIDFLTQNYAMHPTEYFQPLHELIKRKNLKEDKLWGQVKSLAEKTGQASFDALENMPLVWKEKNDGELCHIIVKRNHSNLEFVPKEIIKDESNLKNHYLQIIQEDPSTFLCYLPKDVKDYQTICAGIFNDEKHKKELVLGWIPSDARNYELCNIAIKNNPECIRFVPKTLKKYNEKYPIFCTSAVKQDGLCLRYVLASDLTKKQYINICDDAINNNPSSISYVDVTAINETQLVSFWKKAISQKPSLLQSLPKSMLTHEDLMVTTCLDACKENPLLFKSIPQDLKIKYEVALMDIYEKALHIDPSSLESIPVSAQIKQPQMVFDALKKDFHNIKYVPDEIKSKVFDDDKIFKEMEIQQPGIIRYIPKEKLSPEMEERALITNFSDKKYLDQEKVQNTIDTITKTPKKITVIVASQFEDKEINLSRKIYSTKHAHRENHQKEGEHVISVEKKDLPELLKNLKNNNNTPIKLVLLGHGNKEMKEFAGFTPQTIKECIDNKEYPSISKIVFLGCNTVSAKATKEEQDEIKSFLTNCKDEVKIDANTPTEKNIRTSNPDDLSKNSFLGQVYTEITTKLSGVEIELKGASRPLFPDPLKYKFVGANTDIKLKEGGVPFQLDESKRGEDIKKRLKEFKEKDGEALNTAGKYFSIKTPGK